MGRTVRGRSGQRQVAIRVPASASGRYTLQLRLTDVRGHVKTVTRPLHL